MYSSTFSYRTCTRLLLSLASHCYSIKSSNFSPSANNRKEHSTNLGHHSSSPGLALMMPRCPVRR
ncbi:hypothetical protein Plhal304r1_c048g0130051 [Plasmopara halstedii]